MGGGRLVDTPDADGHRIGERFERHGQFAACPITDPRQIAVKRLCRGHDLAQRAGVGCGARVKPIVHGEGGVADIAERALRCGDKIGQHLRLIGGAIHPIAQGMDRGGGVGELLITHRQCLGQRGAGVVGAGLDQLEQTHGIIGQLVDGLARRWQSHFQPVQPLGQFLTQRHIGPRDRFDLGM